MKIPCPACGQEFVVPKVAAPVTAPAAAPPPALQVAARSAPPPSLPTSSVSRPASGYVHEFKSFPVIAVILLHFLTCGFFSLIWLSILHGRLPRVRSDDPSAGRAFGFCFIPFFNFYWIFFHLRRLCLRVDEQRQLYGLPPSNLRGMATATSICMVIPYLNIILANLITLPIFAAMMQSSVNKLVAQTAVTGPRPTPASQAPKSSKAVWVVVVIVLICFLMIPILAALTIPAFVAARGKAQEVVCVSHEKTLAVAIISYAQEHNGRFPDAASWCDAIKANTPDDLFRCPSVLDQSSRCGYAFNSALSGRSKNSVDPKTVLLFEADGGWNASGGKESLSSTPRHHSSRSDHVVVAFADGSVQSITSSQLSQLRWNP